METTSLVIILSSCQLGSKGRWSGEVEIHTFSLSHVQTYLQFRKEGGHRNDNKGREEKNKMCKSKRSPISRVNSGKRMHKKIPTKLSSNKQKCRVAVRVLFFEVLVTVAYVYSSASQMSTPAFSPSVQRQLL